MTNKMFTIQTKALGDRQVETIASTAALDRENDRILASAWRLDNYKSTGAPVLWGHDYSLPPIARSVDVRVVGTELRTRDEFPPRGLYDLADTVYDLVKAGFVNAKSVGFRPLKWRANDEGGRDYTEVELLEHSYVSVPAAPSAVVVARGKGVRDQAALDRFFGIPRSATRDLDVSRAEVVSALHSPEIRAAITEAATRHVKWAAMPNDAVVLTLEDEHPDVLAGLTAEDVLEALRSSIGAEVAAGVTRAVNLARGRVD